MRTGSVADAGATSATRTAPSSKSGTCWNKSGLGEVGIADVDTGYARTFRLSAA